MSKKNSPIKELVAMLNENKRKPNRKRLLEGYLSEQDFDPSMQQQGQGGLPPQYMDDKEDDFPLQGMEGGNDDAMAKGQGILPIKNEIDQIRQIALKTIAQLAEDPTAESYQMMKKIWMMCDKAIESALQPEDERKGKKNYF